MSATPPATSSNNEFVIDHNLFFRHYTTIQNHLQGPSREKWGNVDAIVIIEGGVNEDIYSKTAAFQSWLCGYELTDTLIVFCKGICHILTSPTKVKLFEQMRNNLENASILKIWTKKRENTENVENLNAIIQAIKGSYKGVTIGTLTKEQQKGSFAKSWEQALASSSLKIVDITSAISEVLSIKDENDMGCVRTSASITTAILKKIMLPEIENIVDEEMKVSHNAIAAKVESIFQNPSKLSSNLKNNMVESCYCPIIQSGGQYNLEMFAKNDEKNLDTQGTIICSLGARYKQLCSDVARTYFIDPTKEQKAAYELLYKIHESVIHKLKPGVKLNDVWAVAKKELSSHPNYASKFTNSCGWGTGIQFRDSDLIITEGNDKVVKEGMVFDVRVGFSDLKKSDGTVFAILLSDTILIMKNKVEILTKVPKIYKDVIYQIETEKVSEEEKPARPRPSPQAKNQKPLAPGTLKVEMAEVSGGFSLRKNETLHVVEIGRHNLRSTTARQMKLNKSATNDQKRNKHQKELEKAMIKKFKEASSKKGGKEEKEKEAKDFFSYGSPKDFSIDIARDKITVDSNKESILLPIYGLLVPFHVYCIKNISKADGYLRINFKYPGAPQVNQIFKDPIATYIKELSYRIPDEQNLTSIVKLVTELKKRVMSRDTEMKQKSSLKEQPKLVTAKSRPPTLPSLCIRPNIVGKKTVGTLEAHTNGFRYATSKKGSLDIIYSNIKYAFFQPADNSLIVAIHFHLKSEIMIGKKPVKDVQFYTEVMEASTSLGQKANRWGDAEEIEEEQRERELRNKLNKDFQLFVQKVEKLIPNFEFDIPYKELGFWGVPFRNNVFLTPTVNCLINIIEFPFFVMSLEDVQIAFFERVQFNLKHFDLVFVKNDWSEKEVHITSIPVSNLETIKEWLDSCNIKFYVGTANVAWRMLLDKVTANPKKFWEKGGWSSMFGSGMDKEMAMADDDNEADDYLPSESETGSEEFSNESPSEGSLNEDEDEDVPYNPDEEVAPSWDEHFQKAETDDNKKTLKRKGDGVVDTNSERPAKRARR